MFQQFPEILLTKALHSGHDQRGGRAQRVDGWTPQRIRTFLDVLARTGAVAKAARAVGMSRQSAYALRASAKGEAFDDAWARALLMAAPSISDELMERALNGCVEPIYRGGKLVGQRHRHDNRLAMRLLKQLDRLETLQTPAARAMRAVKEDFDAYLGIVRTGDEEEIDAFLRARLAGHRRRATQTAKLSTLPTHQQSRRDVAQMPKLSSLAVNQDANHNEPPDPPAPTAEAPDCKPSNVSILRANRPSEGSTPVYGFAASASPQAPCFARPPPRLEEAA